MSEHQNHELENAIDQVRHQIAVQIPLVLSFFDARQNYSRSFDFLSEIEHLLDIQVFFPHFECFLDDELDRTYVFAVRDHIFEALKWQHVLRISCPMQIILVAEFI